MNNAPNQRMFHGGIRAAALADQLSARFNDRQHLVSILAQGETNLVQIGSKHGTPVTIHIADTEGGVLVTMSRDRDWLDRVADSSEMIEHAASKPLSLLALVPDVIGELKQENLTPLLWNVINDVCALTLSLAGEEKAPQNPKICEYCGTSNDPQLDQCVSCGGSLPTDLPRICPKCARGHTSEALFCQACGTRLVEG
jgi:hypothetical protein